LTDVVIYIVEGAIKDVVIRLGAEDAGQGDLLKHCFCKLVRIVHDRMHIFIEYEVLAQSKLIVYLFNILIRYIVIKEPNVFLHRILQKEMLLRKI
jgi:hypothetical protein